MGNSTMNDAPPTEADLHALCAETEYAVLLFGADFSMPAKMLKQKLEKNAGEYGSEMTLVWVNAEEQEALQEPFGISAIPSAVLFRKGKVAKQIENCGPSLLKEVEGRESWPVPSCDVAEDCCESS